jgi:hypothetical protein
MAGLLGLASQAHARVRAAQELEARWKALSPEQQAGAIVEWDRLKAALAATRARLEYGPRGFLREFNAARKGEEAAAVDDPRPLGELAKELHAATTAMRAKLDATADEPPPR